jgi:hypothetical protein
MTRAKQALSSSEPDQRVIDAAGGDRCAARNQGQSVSRPEVQRPARDPLQCVVAPLPEYPPDRAGDRRGEGDRGEPEGLRDLGPYEIRGRSSTLEGSERFAQPGRSRRGGGRCTAT